MRFGRTLTTLLCAAGCVIAPSLARAGDGAGLFALPPSRLGTAGPLDVSPPLPRSASSAPVARWITRAIDAIASSDPARPRVTPLVSGGGGGLRVVLPVCEDGCFQYATRAIAPASPDAALASPDAALASPDAVLASPDAALASPDAAEPLLARLIALVRRAPPQVGPPGLFALREEARRARANVPQREANAPPE